MNNLLLENEELKKEIKRLESSINYKNEKILQLMCIINNKNKHIKLMECTFYTFILIHTGVYVYKLIV